MLSTSKSPKVLVLAPAPNQWQSPLFRYLSQHIDLSVAYTSVDVPTDPELGRKPGWGSEASTGGFRWFIVRNGRHRILRWSLGELRKSEYEVMVLPGWASSESRMFLLAFAALRGKTRTRLVVVSDATELTDRSTSKAWGRSLVLRLLAKWGVTFGATGIAARRHLEKVGIPGDRVTRLPYAVDNDAIAGRVDELRKGRRQLRSQRLGCDDQALVFLAVSKFVGREGVLTLLEAFLKVADGYPFALLLLVGDGPQRPEVEAAIEGAQSKRVILPGYVAYRELPSYYAMADWFLHFPQREPWGLSVNEAAAARLPILCSTRVGAAQDLVKYGVNGRVVPPDLTSLMTGLRWAMTRSACELEELAAASARLSRRVHYEVWLERLRALAARPLAERQPDAFAE
jgi:glycosyltransferase involved in cell wall biosynthesis